MIYSKQVWKIILNSINKLEIRLEDFILLKVLGRGAFGKVMLVKLKNDAIGQLYAMKSISKANIIENE